MKDPKPIKVPGYTATLRAGGWMGYVHATFKRDSDGREIGNVGISRLNYATDRAHRAALKAELLRAIAKAEGK